MLREYVGSEENRLVQIAAHALLAREPRYTPLVLYGPTGTGKSFLALGLAERWRQANPGDTVIVTSGSDFARSYSNAVDTDNLTTFRQKSRTADLFVLDDLHALRSKRSAQSELSRALDVLEKRGKAVLITSDGPPGVDDALRPALRSRLLSGLPVPLVVPGPPARRLLLRRLAAKHNVCFTDEAIELLAGGPIEDSSILATVPQLNHAVLQLTHADEPSGATIDIDAVRRFLSDRTLQNTPTLPAITSLVARYFSLSSRDLRGPWRRRNVVRARGIAMSLAWELTGKSLEAIGRYFGKRDHTTVLHACRRTELLRETDMAIAKAWNELIGKLRVP
jgi:chromosomal replication initiator protein